MGRVDLSTCFGKRKNILPRSSTGPDPKCKSTEICRKFPTWAPPTEPTPVRWQVAVPVCARTCPAGGCVRLRVQQGLLLMTPISFFGSKVPLPGGEPECGPDEYKPEGLSRCCKQCPAGESQGIFWSLEGRPSQAGEGRLWALGAHRAGGWAGRPPRLRWVDRSLAASPPSWPPGGPLL